MRKILSLVLGMVAVLAATGTAAQAAPNPSGTSGPHVITRSRTVQKMIHTGYARDANVGVAPNAALQDGPTNCDNSLSYTYHDEYSGDTDLLLTLEFEFSAKMLCTGSPGSSLERAFFRSNTLWDSHGTVASANPRAACINCNLLNSLGSWVCVSGVSCADTYWTSAYLDMTMPVGWHWIPPLEEGCTLSSDERTLSCTNFTDMSVIPAALD